MRRRCLVSLLLCSLLAGPAWASVRSGVTSLRLDPAVLADLGIRLVETSGTAPPLRPGAAGFQVVAGSRLEFDRADFEGFGAAELRHRGGFALAIEGETLRFPGLVLRAAEPPHQLELRDASGAVQLRAHAIHARVNDAGRSLRLANADLVIAPSLAARLGRPELAGSYLGVLDGEYALGPAPPGSGVSALEGGCVADFGPPPDVELIGLSGLTQAVRAGGLVAMAANATLRNNGPGDVAWNRAIAPATPVGPHPLLAQHFYRLSGGVLEPIGLADLKHAFFATNSNCSCAGGQVLFAGCEDVYGVSTNLDREHLALRGEIDAVTRAWASLGSHFDGLPVDDFRDHGGAEHGAFEHRLVVAESDLQTQGARYFVESWYLAERDANLLNSLGHLEVTPILAGSTWAFPSVGTLVPGSILDELVDPLSPGPGTASELVDTGEGRLQLAAVTTDLGGGVHRYRYHLMNFDFERRVHSFSLPLLASQTVSNPEFRDADGDPLNDWSVAITADAVTWTAPAGNDLDWGTLYGFAVDVDAPPVATGAQLRSLDPGGRLDPIATLGPALAAVPAFPSWLLPLLAAALVVAFACRRPA